jgi:hypothetical protein
MTKPIYGVAPLRANKFGIGNSGKLVGAQRLGFALSHSLNIDILVAQIASLELKIKNKTARLRTTSLSPP